MSVLTTGHTLTLDPRLCDLTLDGNGDIAVSAGAYAVAQNVANAVRLFTNDAWYDPDRGIPHFALELGHKPGQSVLRSRLINAALGVEGVASAAVEFTRFEERNLEGVITITTTTGDVADVAF